MTAPDPAIKATETTSRTAWLVFSVAVTAYVVAVVHRTAFGVASDLGLERFGIEATALSMLAVVQIAFYAGFQVPAGNLLDRLGPARVIVAGSVLMAGGQLLMAYAPTFWWALVARALIGAGDAPVFIGVARLVASHFPPKRAPIMVQLTGLIGQTGQLASAIPLAYAVHSAGWTKSFASLAILGGVTAAAVWLILVRPMRGAASAQPRGAGVADAIKTHWTTPGVRLGFWSHFLGPFSANTIALLWGMPFFTTAQGLSRKDASLLLTCMVIANIAVGPLIGIATARYPLRRTWLVLGGAAVTALAWTVLLIPSTPRPLWQLIAFVTVVGAGGPMSLVGMDFARSFAVEHRLGSANGFVNMGGFVATIIAVLLVGVVLQIAAPGATVYPLDNYRLAFASLAVPFLIGSLGVIRSRKDTRAAMALEGIVVPPMREAWQARRRGQGQ